MADAFPITFGRYELVERLAVGGMAELFLARATGAHGFAKTLVIKRILPHLAADQQFTTMFIDEAKITARLAHPKIAQTYELGHEAGGLYIAMEFVEGLDVLAILRECAHRRVRISPELSVYVCKEVLDALDFAHRLADDAGKPLGIVHRDISPSNVLISRRGDVKLVDFGIAHALASDHHTKAGTLKGKYGYMSPEQVLGSGVTGQSDLFSVGVVLAEMLTGRRLFAAPNELDVLLMVRDVKLERLDKFGTHIAPDLLTVLRRGLAKSQAERYPDAAAFRDALDEWLFDNRHRIGPKNVADLVESLHTDALARREATLAESLAKQGVPVAAGSPAPAVAAPAVAAPVPAAALPARVAAAPPRGEAVPEPGPEDDATSRFVRRAPASEGPGFIDLGDLMGDFPAPASPAPAEAPLTGSIELDLGGPPEPSPTKRAATEMASPRARRAPPPAPRGSALPQSEDDGPAGPGFGSIGAAVVSVSKARPRGLDAVVADFDGSDIADLAGRKKLPAPPARMPTAEEAARAPKPAPPQVADISDTPAEAGDLAVRSPIQLLYQLAVGKTTGLLVVSLGELKKEIYVAEGVPEFVSSNLAGELFGNYLVAEGAVSSGELDMALAMLPYFGGKLGDTLVGLGLMKPLDVFRHLTRQVRSKLLDVCTWSKGSYTWYLGKKNPREAFPLDLDPFEVIGAGAMACSGEVVSDWAASRSAVIYRANPKPKIPVDRFKVGKAARDVLAAFDGRTTLGDALRRVGKDDERIGFLRVLHLFVLAEHLRPA